MNRLSKETRGIRNRSGRLEIKLLLIKFTFEMYLNRANSIREIRTLINAARFNQLSHV